jgi:Tfp pilus assembly protein PilO
VKKKLARLNLKVQLILVVVGLAVFAFAGHKFFVAPKTAAASSLQHQIDHQTTMIYERKAELRKGAHPPTIEVADLFKLARAMPDRLDMPGIILTLSQIAREAGISFALIEPSPDTAVPSAGAYQTQRIHLQFDGDFYGLSDFLYRLRSLVAVHDGTLRADGRLFNVDTVTFSVAPGSFPQISAELYVNAYLYAGGATGSASSTPGATAAPTTTDATTTTATPDGATATGLTP